MNIKEIFDKHEDEFLKFNRVENKRSSRPDIHAFLLLNELVPHESSMVSAAEHDEIFLGVSPDELARCLVTEDQIIELIRCGVRLDSSTDSLMMFA